MLWGGIFDHNVIYREKKKVSLLYGTEKRGKVNKKTQKKTRVSERERERESLARGEVSK